MDTRGQFLAAAGTSAGAVLLSSCSSAGDAYTDAANVARKPFAANLTGQRALALELVRYATLAPSSHNTQCWRFRIAPNSVVLEPDYSRRLPIVDADDHHLFVSLGCATENLVQAAQVHGLQSDTRYDPATSAVRVTLQAAKPKASALFDAIPNRQCTRGEYDGKPLSLVELRALEAAGRGAGVRVLLLTARPQIERVLEFVVEGNTVQMNDPGFMLELRQWIRFSDRDAIASGDGLASRTSGNPSVPPWLGNAMLNIFFTPKLEGDKYAKFIRSSAGIAVFVSDTSDRKNWIEAGRCYERFALQATALNVRTAMLNQPVEVAAIRAHFASALGLGAGRPDLVVRFGHGPTMPRSLRRSLASVII